MIRLALTLALAAALTLALAGGPASAHYAARGMHCGQINFTPQSDDVASAIYARNVSCRTARRMVKIYRRQGDRTPLGFRCSFRGHDPRYGLGHGDAVCKASGDRRVSWAQY